MKVIITIHALAVIEAIADFVESKNTPGSGKRYFKKFKEAIKKLAQANTQYALCLDPRLAAFNYSCGHFNDWVIVFRIENGALIVYQVIHGATLV